MKKIVSYCIAFGVVLILILTVLLINRGDQLARQNNELNAELSEARLENQMTSRQLETSLITLAETSAYLAETKQTLVKTEETLISTERVLSATSENLTVAEEKSAAAAEEIEDLLNKLALTSNKLSLTENELKLVLGEKAKAEAHIAELIQAQSTLGLPAPQYKGTWDYSRAYPFLIDRFPSAKVLIRASVKLVSLKDWQEFSAADNVNATEYFLQDFNCTEYAFILEGRARAWAPAAAFGIVVVERTGIDQPGYYHYMNFFIDETGKLWLIEPQNDAIFQPPPDWRYLLILI